MIYDSSVSGLENFVRQVGELVERAEALERYTAKSTINQNGYMGSAEAIERARGDVERSVYWVRTMLKSLGAKRGT